MTGLDPAAQCKSSNCAGVPLDARVKPAHDGETGRVPGSCHPYPNPPTINPVTLRANPAASFGRSPSCTRARSSSVAAAVSISALSSTRLPNASITGCFGFTSSTGGGCNPARPARRISRCNCKSGPFPLGASTTALSVSRAVARTSATSSPSAAFKAASQHGDVRQLRALRQFVARLGHADQPLALERGQPVRPERIDRIRQQQHLEPLGAEPLQLRRRPQRIGIIADQVVNLVLPRLHAVHVIGQRRPAVLPR